VHVPRYALLWPAYFYGVPPSSNSRHSAATERNYHIGARVQAGKRTLFVLRLDLLRPFFQPITPRAFNPLSTPLLSTARGFKIKFGTLEGPTANFVSPVPSPSRSLSSRKCITLRDVFYDWRRLHRFCHVLGISEVSRSSIRDLSFIYDR